jgi:hypothetical protein
VLCKDQFLCTRNSNGDADADAMLHQPKAQAANRAKPVETADPWMWWTGWI